MAAATHLGHPPVGSNRWIWVTLLDLMPMLRVGGGRAGLVGAPHGDLAASSWLKIAC